MGRKSQYYIKVEPYLDDIKEWKMNDALDSDIYTKLGVTKSTWYDYINKYSDLANTIKISKKKLTLDIKDTLYRKSKGLIVKTKKYYKYINGEQILDRIEEETPLPTDACISMALKILDPSCREILNNTIVLDNKNKGYENFQSFSEQMNNVGDYDGS